MLILTSTQLVHCIISTVSKIDEFLPSIPTLGFIGFLVSFATTWATRHIHSIHKAKKYKMHRCPLHAFTPLADQYGQKVPPILMQKRVSWFYESRINESHAATYNSHYLTSNGHDGNYRLATIAQFREPKKIIITKIQNPKDYSLSNMDRGIEWWVVRGTLDLVSGLISQWRDNHACPFHIMNFFRFIISRLAWDRIGVDRLFPSQFCFGLYVSGSSTTHLQKITCICILSIPFCSRFWGVLLR